jgi:hypothetical protein
MQFKGAVRQITQQQTGTSKSGKDWTKQNIVVEEIVDQFPNSILFEAFNKPLDGIGIGMIVTVDYNAKVSEYEGKFYNSMQIWKIEKVFSEMKKPDSALSISNPWVVNPY